ncbi:hypothetical protein TorRG33x02_341870 [Trema orientale]|uniref:Uncharacterized protein n=1 Tax=Trema orientale TaxID=63057 RepID=A0A2P5AT67_TREOI|nr:hypothetical protein TorRG33x02_341870 [Trema orientale]
MVWRSAVMIDADLVVHFVIRHVFIWGWSSLMRLGMIIRSKSLTCSFSTRDRNGSSIERIMSYNFKSDELEFVYEKYLFCEKFHPTLTVIPGCFFPVFTFRICLLPFQGLDKRTMRCTPMHVAYTER